MSAVATSTSPAPGKAAQHGRRLKTRRSIERSKDSGGKEPSQGCYSGFRKRSSE